MYICMYVCVYVYVQVHVYKTYLSIIPLGHQLFECRDFWLIFCPRDK